MFTSSQLRHALVCACARVRGCPPGGVRPALWSAALLGPRGVVARHHTQPRHGHRHFYASPLACTVPPSTGGALLDDEDSPAAASPQAAQPASRRGPKSRLDALALELYPQYSRTLLQSWILQGKVLVDGVPVTKAGAAVSHASEVTITAEDPKFVCRAGYKLEAALVAFGVDVTSAVALDSGLSTGGFTDCLLQRGAARVYGVDVGYGQVADRIRTDPRVTVMERCNLRHLTSLPELVDLATLDLSFISVLKVLPAVKALLKPAARVVVLVKPQFEALRGEVGRGGVVRDPAVHDDVLRRVKSGAQDLGFRCLGTMRSPLRGAKEGNIEFLCHFDLDASNATGAAANAAGLGQS
jgi:23S rRNA (cytidine1920-2'-O)/16S rRNA (cytidine1409-2'-O)-methyltransferase